MNFVDAVHHCRYLRVWRDMGDGQEREIMIDSRDGSVIVYLWTGKLRYCCSDLLLSDVQSVKWQYAPVPAIDACQNNCVAAPSLSIDTGQENEDTPLIKMTEDKSAQERLEEKVAGLSSDIKLLVRGLRSRLSSIVDYLDSKGEL